MTMLLIQRYHPLDMSSVDNIRANPSSTAIKHRHTARLTNCLLRAGRSSTARSKGKTLLLLQ